MFERVGAGSLETHGKDITKQTLVSGTPGKREEERRRRGRRRACGKVTRRTARGHRPESKELYLQIQFTDSLFGFFFSIARLLRLPHLGLWMTPTAHSGLTLREFSISISAF